METREVMVGGAGGAWGFIALGFGWEAGCDWLPVRRRGSVTWRDSLARCEMLSLFLERSIFISFSFSFLNFEYLHSLPESIRMLYAERLDYSKYLYYKIFVCKNCMMVLRWPNGLNIYLYFYPCEHLQKNQTNAHFTLRTK